MLAFVLVAVFNTSTGQYAENSRLLLSMDSDWKFVLGDQKDAEKAGFDDSEWRTLDVPHDWSIEGPFDEKNSSGRAGGFLPGGIGWYRKHFTLPAGSAQRYVFVEFDGVMANSDVWINGVHLGNRPYGYVSFSYDLTGKLNFGAGKTNVLAVRVDNSRQPASRWYSGAGIYRHVRLGVTDPIHVEQWGTFVTTPQVSADKATVHVQSTVTNQSNAERTVLLRVSVIDPEGRLVQTRETSPQIIPAGKSALFSQELAVNNPRLWDLSHPFIYRLLTRVIADKRVLDDDNTGFGIREFHFDAATGFWLNGKNFKLKGVCLHHDVSAFGAAVPLAAWERRINLLKQLGVNAVRTAHNPPAPEFLDLCDRMGVLVMDEMFDCWTVAKNPYDYHLYFDKWSSIDTRDTVRRDRNHPSIVLYSAGNEIHDTPKADLAKRILKQLVEVFHANDPTRPVTQALFRPNVSHDYDNGLADMLDVIGTNYRDSELLAAHHAKPQRKIIGTEQGHERRIWLLMRDNPQHAGQFLWSGIDYLGESPRWPTIAHNSGLLDRTGTRRPLAYERQSWWSAEPMVHITRRVAPTALSPTDPGYDPSPRRPQVLFSDWTPSNLGAHEEEVEIYSNCEQVELFLNDRSLGAKHLPTDAAPRVWKVSFEKGTIRALGRNGGKIAARHELRTAGKAAKLTLSADRKRLAPIWDDVSYITAAVVDENGVLVPTASELITFKAAGPGSIVAVDSGNNSSHEPFRATERRAYQGKCFAILRANAGAGRITLTASAPGLIGSSVNIQVVAPYRKK